MSVNCYDCKHRGGIPGDCHSKCQHPAIGSDAEGLMMSMGLVPNRLGIRGNAHGIRNGWFCWPINFDPVWLESCNGFEQKGGEVIHEQTKKQ